MGEGLDIRALHGKRMQAQGAGQGARSPRQVDAGDQGGQALAGGLRLIVQHRPEFFLQRHRGAMAGQGKGAFFEQDYLGAIMSSGRTMASNSASVT